MAGDPTPRFGTGWRIGSETTLAGALAAVTGPVIAAGAASGSTRGSPPLVVDVDGPDNPWPGDADRALRIADAPVSLTPSGGQHVVFRLPDGRTWRLTTGRLAPSVDVRTTGGYLVAPASEIYGRPYRWEQGGLELGPDELPEPPDWLAAGLDAIEAGRGVVQSGQVSQEPVAEGGRNDALTRRAGRMRRFGASQGEIEAALLVANAELCSPPLEEREVLRIARSVG